MKKNRFFVYCATFAALVATGFIIKTDPAIAQQASEEQTSEEVQELILVEAPIERRKVGRADAIGARTEIIELRRQVSFADLDLSKHADVTELEKRIETTAKESCEKLDEMYPLATPDSIRRCTESAIKSTEEKVQAAIAAAE